MISVDLRIDKDVNRIKKSNEQRDSVILHIKKTKTNVTNLILFIRTFEDYLIHKAARAPLVGADVINKGTVIE